VASIAKSLRFSQYTVADPVASNPLHSLLSSQTPPVLLANSQPFQPLDILMTALSYPSMASELKSSFSTLPTEILVAILDFLPRQTLLYANLVSRRVNDAASTLIWRDVELVDCECTREVPEATRIAFMQAYGYSDDHDRMLLLQIEDSHLIKRADCVLK
jgi:hypothetical protein